MQAICHHKNKTIEMLQFLIYSVNCVGSDSPFHFLGIVLGEKPELQLLYSACLLVNTQLSGKK